MTDQNPARIHALGEIAIRCNDLEGMRAFYRDIVGLTVLRDVPGEGIVFFRIAPGHAGHTCVLALFDKAMGASDAAPRPATGAGSALHHIALTVDAADQEGLIAFLQGKGIACRVQVFDWIGWRGVFIKDPEGNTVEFVAGLSPADRAAGDSLTAL